MNIDSETRYLINEWHGLETTVSAGVAAYDRGIESLLVDVSLATKESKITGRNRTIIYQREQPSIIRDHYIGEYT